MRIRYAQLRRHLLLDVVYDGATVVHTTDVPGFPATTSAPGTNGDLCVAKMAGYRTPVALVYTLAGACCGAVLVVAYPNPSGKYAVRDFVSSGVAPFRVDLLGRSLAIVGGDPRFSFLFTDGAGSASPVRVERLEDGRLVDVSRHFPQVLAADASRLTASTHSQAYQVDRVWAFIGELNAWVADECRLGKGSPAWKATQQAVDHGRYRHWMAKNEPHYLSQLKADLVRWGYCPSAR